MFTVKNTGAIWRSMCRFYFELLVAARTEIRGTVNSRTNIPMQCAVEGHFLGEEYGRHLIGGIDPEQRRGGAVPEEFADGPAVLFGLLRLRDSYREIQPEAHGAFAG